MEKTEKQKTIIKTSKLLFLKYGVKKVSVEEICSLVQISKRTFYKYYPNKFELAKEILNVFKEKELQIFKDLRDKNIDFSEKIIQMTHKQLQLYSDAEMIFFRDVTNNCKELVPFIREWKAEGERHLFEFVSEEQKFGRVRSDVPARFITYMISHQFNEVFFSYEVEKMLPNFKEKVRLVVDCFINGLGEVKK